MAGNLVWKSFNKKSEVEFPYQKPVANHDEFENDDAFFSDEDTVSTEVNSNKENTSTIIDDKRIDKVIEEQKELTDNTPKAKPISEKSKETEVIEKPITPKVVTPEETAPTSKSGNFIVIAGNYLVEKNATEMVKKLKSAGFKNAEKVVFDLSEFHTVIVGKYSNSSEATKTVNAIKAKGLDAYVHRQ
jgi:cell division septation protein DedD